MDGVRTDIRDRPNSWRGGVYRAFTCLPTIGGGGPRGGAEGSSFHPAILAGRYDVTNSQGEPWEELGMSDEKEPGRVENEINEILARTTSGAGATPAPQGARDPLDRELRQIKEIIVRMGSLTEAAIRDALTALTTHDAALAEKIIVNDRTDDTLYEHTSRPYPSGGATYDLELYLTVDRCDGLEPGLYHYDPDRHALEHLDQLTAATGQMLLDATGATGGLVRPQVLLTVASRFARISWKYEGMAYATTLRNVGAFYQTLWLVATAMGIACCPLGGGDASAFAEATGLDPYVESNVGEVTLGRLASEAQRGNQFSQSRPGAWAERA